MRCGFEFMQLMYMALGFNLRPKLNKTAVCFYEFCGVCEVFFKTTHA